MDFAFVVHPRGIADIRRAYPALASLADDELVRQVQDQPVHVIGKIVWRWREKPVSGELLAVPFLPAELLTQRDRVVQALHEALDYCEDRGARIVGLGGLLPSATRAGRALIGKPRRVGVTTGHSYTAVAIAQYVRNVESALDGGVRIAVLGAAGSTGRAALRCLARDGRQRELILIDQPVKRRALEELADEIGGLVGVATSLDPIKAADVLVCVTNASCALVTADMLAEGCVVIDDAQPENVSLATVHSRPDVVTIKCLARVPKLRCTFDFGLFTPAKRAYRQEWTFTCLAETLMLAAVGHGGDYTIGDPTAPQMKQLAGLARRFGIGTQVYHSFPEIGEICL
jgi:predicted amino acid dehydrogenase